MLKAIIVFVTIVFSVGAIAGQDCSVYLPGECKEILDSDVSFYSEDPFSELIFLIVEVGCRVEHAGELANGLMAKDAFYNYKKYKLKVEVATRIEDYNISFLRERVALRGTKPPYLICYQ